MEGKSQTSFKKLFQILTAKEEETRKRGWLSVPMRHAAQAFGQAELKKLRELLVREQDLDCRTLGTISYVEVLHAAGGQPVAEKLSDWLFEPFWRRGDAAPSDQKSLVFSAYENKGIRDAAAQLAISRMLPPSDYSGTSFFHVPLEHPEWEDMGIGQAQAVCFVGRPMMFSQCSMIEHFPSDLRFSIVPPDTGDDAGFYCVTENRPHAGQLRFPTVEHGARRTDYAIVQRFPVVLGGHTVIVIVIAGATSLGTAGAAQWVSRFPWTPKSTVEYARVAGLKAIERTTRFEALLEVKAVVHAPSRPWKPEPEAKALFLHHSRNLLGAPSRIALVTESGGLTHAADVQCLLFDEHEMNFGETDTPVVIAFLVKCCLENTREVRISDLMSDTRLWPGEAPAPRSNKVFLSDHLQRRSLNGLVEVTAHSIRLGKCELAVIPARLPAVGVRNSSSPTSSRAAGGGKRRSRNT